MSEHAALELTSCKVCDAPLGDAIYCSPERYSITSLCQILPGQTAVYFWAVCALGSAAVVATLWRADPRRGQP